MPIRRNIKGQFSSHGSYTASGRKVNPSRKGHRKHHRRKR